MRRELAPVEEEASPEETVQLILSNCHTIEAVLFCYAEMHLCGNPGKYNRVGIGYDCHSPLMAELIPHFVHRFPEQWKVYCAELVGSVGQMNDFISKLEAGPLLSFDEIAERSGTGPASRRTSRLARRRSRPPPTTRLRGGLLVRFLREACRSPAYAVLV